MTHLLLLFIQGWHRSSGKRSKKYSVFIPPKWQKSTRPYIRTKATHSIIVEGRNTATEMEGDQNVMNCLKTEVRN